MERRDDEIQRLRCEVGRLREIAGMAALVDGMEELDLMRDLDAIEASGHVLGRGGTVQMDDVYEGDEDG